MTDNEITIEVAKLDGRKVEAFGEGELSVVKGGWLEKVLRDAGMPNYLTSRDAIIPVVEKQNWRVHFSIIEQLQCGFKGDGRLACLFATPRQLCIALLKATRKGKE